MKNLGHLGFKKIKLAKNPEVDYGGNSRPITRNIGGGGGDMLRVYPETTTDWADDPATWNGEIAFWRVI